MVASACATTTLLQLYDMIPIGTIVNINGHILGDLDHEPRDLAEGDVGGDVQLIQSHLISAGYFISICNGKFRADTTAAIKQFHRDYGLIPNGVVSVKVYEQLGLLE